MTEGRLKDRIALITGASRGIGAAVARCFAREGAHLVLVARTIGGLEELDDEIQTISGSPATLVPMDLTNFDEIDHMGATLYERFGHLDILVGNAAILGTLSPMGHIDPKIWDQVMATNLTANWRLLRSMDPLLQRSDSGRAIFVTSTVGADPRAYWGAYATSKAALEMMVKIYAAENANTHLRANLINPGATRTGMRAQAMPGEDPSSVKSPDEVAEAFLQLAEPACEITGTTLDCR
jgi:NAD(P)-dependent dehydrogenase (short-subunit alcohol dehydrogenase family)